jgi:hypothetical protein
MVFHQGRVTISRTCNLADLVGPEWRAGTSFTLAPLAMVRLEKWKDPCRSLSQCHPIGSRPQSASVISTDTSSGTSKLHEVGQTSARWCRSGFAEVETTSAPKPPLMAEISLISRLPWTVGRGLNWAALHQSLARFEDAHRSSTPRRIRRSEPTAYTEEQSMTSGQAVYGDTPH